MNDWPVGLSTGCFYQRSIFDCLEPVRESGFSMIEICSFPAHLDYHDLNAVRRAAQRVDELGLEAYSFHAPFADHITKWPSVVSNWASVAFWKINCLISCSVAQATSFGYWAR